MNDFTSDADAEDRGHQGGSSEADSGRGANAGGDSTTFDVGDGFGEAYRDALQAVVSDPEFRLYRGHSETLISRVDTNSRTSIIEEVKRARHGAKQRADSMTNERVLVGATFTRARRWLGGSIALTVVMALGLLAGFASPSTQSDQSRWVLAIAGLVGLGATVVNAIRVGRLTQLLRSIEASEKDAAHIEEIVVRDSLRNLLSSAYSTAISELLAQEGLLDFPRIAPRLVELDAESIVPLRSIDRVSRFILEHPTSAIGITGPRGVGKSTLMAAVCARVVEEGGEAILIPSPVEHDTIDLLRSIAVALRREHWRERQNREGYRARRVRLRTRMLALAGVGSLAYGALALLILGLLPRAGEVTVDLLRDHWPALVGALLGVSAVMLLIRGNLFRRLSSNSLYPLSYQVLDNVVDSLSFETVDSASVGGTIGAKSMEISGERSRTRTSRELTHARLSAALRDVLRAIGDERAGPFVLAIDELDKLPNRDALLSTVNAVKDLLHLRNVHVAMTLSEEALGSFELRQTSERDAFDSTFDTIFEVERLNCGDAIAIVESRVAGFPRPLVLACHVWAGGLPRDLLRHIRECVEYVRELGDVPAWFDVAYEMTEAEAVRKMRSALRAGSLTAGLDVIRQAAANWRMRSPVVDDFDDFEALDEPSRRLCAYIANRYLAIWLVRDAEAANIDPFPALERLRDAVAATSTNGALSLTRSTLVRLAEDGYFARNH